MTFLKQVMFWDWIYDTGFSFIGVSTVPVRSSLSRRRNQEERRDLRVLGSSPGPFCFTLLGLKDSYKTYKHKNIPKKKKKKSSMDIQNYRPELSVNMTREPPVFFPHSWRVPIFLLAWITSTIPLVYCEVSALWDSDTSRYIAAVHRLISTRIRDEDNDDPATPIAPTPAAHRPGIVSTLSFFFTCFFLFFFKLNGLADVGRGKKRQKKNMLWEKKRI